MSFHYSSRAYVYVCVCVCVMFGLQLSRRLSVADLLVASCVASTARRPYRGSARSLAREHRPQHAYGVKEK